LKRSQKRMLKRGKDLPNNHTWKGPKVEEKSKEKGPRQVKKTESDILLRSVTEKKRGKGEGFVKNLRKASGKELG